METMTIYLLFVVGVLLIIKGGDIFVDSASGLAKVFGVPDFIIGATIVSLATTTPEILVSVMAALEGKVDMAIGNAVGSVTANTGLILGISMIFLPSAVKRIQYLPKSLLLILAVAGLWLFSRSGSLSIAGSLILLGIFVAFLVENLLAGRRESKPLEKQEKDQKQIGKYIGGFVIGAAGIVIGSRLMVDNGSSIAEQLGVPENVIALTMVAIGTSLPELVTAITAIVKKQAALSAGNIIGANIIDTTLILPVCTFLSGGSLPVSAQTVSLDLPVCLGIVLTALVPMLITKRFHRLQGIIGIGAYGAYLVSICV